MSKQLTVERDPHTGQFNEGSYGHGGVAMQLSWDDVQEILRAEGICPNTEYISRIKADADGLLVYFEKF